MTEMDALHRALCCGPTCGRGTAETGPCAAPAFGAAIERRARAAGFVVLSSTWHDYRITALLQANNAEVERRRAAEAEAKRLQAALEKIARHPWAARNPSASINERVRDMVSQIITTAATALQKPQGCVSAAPTGCVSDSECAAAGRCLEHPDASEALAKERGIA